MVSKIRVGPIEQTTGIAWPDWVTLLEKQGARDLDHAAIAALANDKLNGQVDNPAWWAQSVAVAFEQHIGRRLPGQQADGTFQMSVSRSSTLPMDALRNRWAVFASADMAVLELAGNDARTGGTEKRLSWQAKGSNGSSVEILFEPKKDGAASIVVQHSGLPSAEVNAEMKTKWKTIVERFLAGPDLK